MKFKLKNLLQNKKGYPFSILQATIDSEMIKVTHILSPHKNTHLAYSHYILQ
jgi:hypothetical protein